MTTIHQYLEYKDDLAIVVRGRFEVIVSERSQTALHIGAKRVNSPLTHKNRTVVPFPYLQEINTKPIQESLAWVPDLEGYQAMKRPPK